MSGEGYAKRIRFELTKNRLVHKIENVRKIICNLINVYDVDIKIENFYNKQIQSFEIISEDIFSKLTSLSEDMKYDNFILSARGQVVFNALNEKINKFITQFLLGNSKFFKKLKFQYKNKKESMSSNETDIEMIFRKRKRIKSFLIFIATTILSFGIGLLVNFISKLLGI